MSVQYQLSSNGNHVKWSRMALVHHGRLTCELSMPKTAIVTAAFCAARTAAEKPEVLLDAISHPFAHTCTRENFMATTENIRTSQADLYVLSIVECPFQFESGWMCVCPTFARGLAYQAAGTGLTGNREA